MRSPASSSSAASFKKAGLFFVSENYLPDPQWEAVHYRHQQLQFPFFSSEPLVIVLELYAPFLQQCQALLQELQDLKMQTQLIFFSLDIPEKEILDLFNIRRPFRLIKTNKVNELQGSIQEAIEQAQHQKQEQVLYELFQEQNKELKKISQNLEERIEKRQTHLEEAKAKLFATNEKNLFLQNGLFAVHNSVDIPDLEKKVTAFLKSPLSVDWFRIYFGPNNLSEKNSSLHLYRFSLLQGETEYGQLVFARSQGAPFRREERDFLEQMCEAISLCLERMLQIERNKDLQSQWQSTFNAILDPVCLIDEDYTLRLANKSLSDTQKEAVVGQKCYQVLFQRSSPCDDCHRGQSFRLRDQSQNPKIFDVFSQSMSIDYQKSYFHLYRDVSQQLGLERQLVESAKMAELGTISSSIAHELNNPLGGMINFIQLIRMDLKQEEPLSADISEMETAAQRCKEIIKNLLGFSRISHESETQSVSLAEIIQRAIMITELRTRSMGVRIEYKNTVDKIMVNGRFNPLAQVFCNVLQNSYESILERRQKNTSFIGNISIEIFLNSKTVEIKILDDGMGLSKNTDHHFFDPLFTTKDPNKHSGLGLTLARQILTEHSAQIELTSEKDGKTCVQIRFPRLSSDPF